MRPDVKAVLWILGISSPFCGGAYFMLRAAASEEQWALWAVGLSLAIAGVVAWKLDAFLPRRHEALEKYARENSLRYLFDVRMRRSAQRGLRGGPLRFLEEIPLFAQGEEGSRKADNVIILGRRQDAEAFVFDYSYDKDSLLRGEDSSCTRYQTVFCFQSSRLNLPPFALRPERIWHKAAALAGWQDIDFQSHPGFSAKYLLRGPDEAAVRARFGPSLLSFLEQEPPLWIEGAKDQLIVYRAEEFVEPANLPQAIAQAGRIYARFTFPDDRG